MWGNKVAVNAPVSYQGPANYAIGSAPAPGTGAVAAATTPQTIPVLDPDTKPSDLVYQDVILHIHQPAGTNPRTKFTLTDSRGWYRQEHTADEDLDPNNDEADLVFSDVPLPGYYTLTADSGSGEYTLFEQNSLEPVSQSDNGS